MKKRILSIALVLLLVLSLLPIAALAADSGKVRVVAENTTLRTETADVGGKAVPVPWHDLLFDTEVAWSEGMTMEAAITAAANAEKAEVNITDSGYGPYLSGVAGLDESQGGGWMAALNDWFCDAGISAVTVEPGDTIRVMYTMNWGADIGGDWSSTDKGLKDLSFSAGALYPAFSHDTADYTLYLPDDVKSVLVTPTAVNKYNKVFVTAEGEKDVRWGAREFGAYAGTVTVQVADGMAYTVKLVPVAAPKPTTRPLNNPFEDVAENNYFYDPVLWAVNHDPQITKGTSETTFSPEKTCTRAQVVTFLWRAASEPKPAGGNNPFSDVAEGRYYYDAVLWAVGAGVTNGVDDTHFGPDSACTRGQVVTFLYRADKGSVQKDAKNPFTDVAAGAYYYEPVLWAVNSEAQITNGTSETTFSPDAACKRGQIVTFLYRALSAAEEADVPVPEDPFTAASVRVMRASKDPVCNSGDWAVFDIARNALQEKEPMTGYYGEYYPSVVAKAKETEGKMDAKYATDYARITLAVTALGYNAADVGGYDLTAPLSDVAYVQGQGLNGAVYALIALDSGDYASYARPDLLQIILDAQLADGGFNYGFGDDADPDMTAMALQALAPYVDDADVAAAAQKAVNCLAKLQTKDGGFPNAWGDPASETTAQVIMSEQTLLAQPENRNGAVAVKDAFGKGDGSLKANLLSYRLADGGFRHNMADAESNAYATEQALRALLSEQCTALGVTLYGVR